MESSHIANMVLHEYEGDTNMSLPMSYPMQGENAASLYSYDHHLDTVMRDYHSKLSIQSISKNNNKSCPCYRWLCIYVGDAEDLIRTNKP